MENHGKSGRTKSGIVILPIFKMIARFSKCDFWIPEKMWIDIEKNASKHKILQDQKNSRKQYIFLRSIFPGKTRCKSQ